MNTHKNEKKIQLWLLHCGIFDYFFSSSFFWTRQKKNNCKSLLKKKTHKKNHKTNLSNEKKQILKAIFLNFNSCFVSKNTKKKRERNAIHLYKENKFRERQA